MTDIQKNWDRFIGQPASPIPYVQPTLLTVYDYPEFTVELYSQPNGGALPQRITVAIPKNRSHPLPAILVPFYYAEQMLGFDPATGSSLPKYENVAMMRDLALRGYITASCDAYHATYLDSPRAPDDFLRWRDAAAALRQDHPQWSGVGKLISDVRLLTDFIVSDSRVDASRIGIAGHSLGGKMAFYSGCTDSRIRAILASDFGIGWEQTNWRDIWYWGDTVDEFLALHMDNAQLLSLAGSRPLCLLAGSYDNADSWAMMCHAAGYESLSPDCPPGAVCVSPDGRRMIVNHATGHRPPASALAAGYDFLERWV